MNHPGLNAIPRNRQDWLQRLQAPTATACNERSAT